MERRSKTAHRNDRVDPFMAGSPHNACMFVHLGALMAGPDVGANPISSIGDGALLHGAGAGASAGSVGSCAGAMRTPVPV
jgi:hypothetical protein